MEKALSFDRKAELYDKARPGYPKEMFLTIAEACGINNNTTILELGAGNGAATIDICKNWEPYLTILEPGENLINILRRKLAGYPKASFVCCGFEDFESDDKFDVVFCATAFHWIQPEIRYQKTYNILKDKGYLVLCWNNYCSDDSPVFDALQKVYRDYHPGEPVKEDIRILQRKKREARRDELRSSKGFQYKFGREYSAYINMKTKEYINLLKTFSPNAIHPNGIIEPFYNEIEKVIDAFGGNIRLPVVTQLEIGQRV